MDNVQTYLKKMRKE